MNIESQIHLNRFKPRNFQLPFFDAVENKGYRRVLLIWPRRAGKDVSAFNLAIRAAIRKPQVIYYIFPTYSQGRKVIFDTLTNDGDRMLEFIPKELVSSINNQELKIRFVNGSIIQIVGSDNYDCYDDQTEILTENGWKLFCDLDRNEKVATLDPVRGELVYKLPNDYIEQWYEGDLYAVSNSSMDFRVTPNHKFWVRSPKGQYKFKEISDPTIASYAIPSQSGWIGNMPGSRILGFKTKDFLAFLGIYLAEGSTFSNHKCYRITISQVKPAGRARIKALLHSMGLQFVEHKSGFNIENHQLYDYCAQFGLQPHRFIPKDIKMLDKEYLEILFDWLILGDGYRCKTYTAYYSTSKKLVDDVQEIIIKLGLSGNIHQRKQKESAIRGRIVTPRHSLYEIRIRKSQFKRLTGASGKSYIHTVPYKGKIYCVSVSSGYSYWRDGKEVYERGIVKVRRNGKECWSGNSLMGTNPKLCIFSEYALQDPRAYQYIRPILTANDGVAIFLSTPRGRNHLWELFQVASNSPDWYCQKLTVMDTHHISLHEIEKERALGELSDDMIQQEYYTSWDLGVEGSYFAKYIDKMRTKGQIGMVPWENGFKVHSCWDLGVRDSTTIIMFQIIGQSIRIIDCYENSKVGLDHYIKVLEQKPYVWGKHIAPHDIRVKEFGSGMTRWEKAKELGLQFTIAPSIGLEDGIEAVRSALSKIWIDDKNCAQLIKALENYRQEYDHKRKVYSAHPLHDWSSHYSDALRYMCISLPKLSDGTTGADIDRRYQEAMYGSNYNMPAVFRDDLPEIR